MAKETKRSKWAPREMHLLNEWLAANYADALVMTRVRLGTIVGVGGGAVPEYSEGRMLGVWRRWADAIVVTQRLLRVVEAKILPQPGVLSQLELYLRLVPHTPELEPYLSRPRRGVLLYAVHDPLIVDMAREKGFECQEYRPPWVDEYLEKLYRRQQRPSQST